MYFFEKIFPFGKKYFIYSKINLGKTHFKKIKNLNFLKNLVKFKKLKNFLNAYVESRIEMEECFALVALQVHLELAIAWHSDNSDFLWWHEAINAASIWKSLNY